MWKLVYIKMNGEKLTTIPRVHFGMKHLITELQIQVEAKICGVKRTKNTRASLLNSGSMFGCIQQLLPFHGTMFFFPAAKMKSFAFVTALICLNGNKTFGYCRLFLQTDKTRFPRKQMEIIKTGGHDINLYSNYIIHFTNTESIIERTN